jgi:hypothetical protein
MVSHPTGFAADRAGDGYIIGSPAQAKDLGVEAYLDVEIILSRLKQEGEPIGSELASFLPGENGVQPALDIRHGGFEDQDVRAKIRGGCHLRKTAQQDSPSAEGFIQRILDHISSPADDGVASKWFGGLDVSYGQFGRCCNRIVANLKTQSCFALRVVYTSD